MTRQDTMNVQVSKMQRNDSHTGPAEDLVNILQPDLAVDGMVSDEITTIIMWLTCSLLSQVVNVFGVGSNIVNIICFVRQGFQDPVNVSFLGLAWADTGCLITIIWSNMCFSPAFIAADLPFEPVEFQHLTGGIPHTTFTRISSWVTAIITMERCLCIIAPIKVKIIVTSKRVSILIICVYITLVANTAPVYVVNKLGAKFYPSRNKTLIGMIFLTNRDNVEKVSYVINNVCFPFIAFIIIIVSTVILVIQLRNKANWRQASTNSAQVDQVSIKNKKVAKMVLMISLLYISCFVPLCVGFIAVSLVPEFSIVGKFKNAIFITVGFLTLLESVNSSANIFIYYHMSSKYKATLRQLFGLSSTS